MVLAFSPELHVEVVRSVARFTAAALVAGLWQGVLLCVAAAAVLKFLPKTTAARRFFAWIAVFGVSAAMPFLNFRGSQWAAGTKLATTSPVVFDARWSYVLVAMWGAAAMFRLAQLIFEAHSLRGLWRSAELVSHEALERLHVSLVVDQRTVEVCTSNKVDRPSVIGFFAPRILIPQWLFAQLTDIELNHIVLHELEHLRRGDDWINLVQKIGLVILPLNPALFWIDRRLSTERELACDDGVLARTHTPRAYAASLASIAERRLDVRVHRRMAALALGVTGAFRRRSELGLRIESILRTQTGRSVGNPVFAAALVIAIVGSAAGLAHLPQLVDFAPHSSAAEIAVVADTPRPSSMHVGRRDLPALQNVNFHVPVRAKAVAKVKVRKAKLDTFMPAESQHTLPRRTANRFYVMTSWQDAPVSRVVMKTPDGRVFLAPYAAVPTPAGWLIVQL